MTPRADRVRPIPEPLSRYRPRPVPRATTSRILTRDHLHELHRASSQARQGLAARCPAALAAQAGPGAEHADRAGRLLRLHRLDLPAVVHQLALHAQLQVGRSAAVPAPVGQRPLVGGQPEPAGVRRSVHRHQPDHRCRARRAAGPTHPPRGADPHHLPVPHGTVDDRHRYRLAMAAQSRPGSGQAAA